LQATIKAQSMDYETNQCSPDYGKRKLEKGKAVDHQQPGKISWIAGVPRLIFVTSAQKRNVFFW
jgi:hypothetical protein